MCGIVGYIGTKKAKEIAKECFNALQQVHECKFNPQRKYIIFKNCVLNIETGEIFENGHFVSDMVLDFDYYPDKRFPFWEEFVQKTVPDAEMRTALQQFCGAFLMDRQKTKIEYICILCGGGQNGKSVLCHGCGTAKACVSRADDYCIILFCHIFPLTLQRQRSLPCRMPKHR